MGTISRLPDEIICLILAQFDSIQVAKLEHVCKQWKNVARSHKSLWKDALFLEGNRDLSTKFVNRRLLALTKRSGGTLDHLGASLDLTDVRIDAIKKFNDRLLTANVQNLWLHMEPNENPYESWEDHIHMGNYNKLVTKTLNTIAQCTNLKSLHVQLFGSTMFEHDAERFPRKLASKPIAQCKLERITLNGFRNDTLFEDDALFHMLEKARVIEITLKDDPVPEKHALRLLEGAKDTLEECQFDILEDKTLTRSSSKILTLPHLFRLYLCSKREPGRRMPQRSIAESESQTEDVSHVFSGTSLDCPRLKEVYLEGQISSSLRQDLLKDSLETLHIDMMHNPLLSKASLLKNCTRLKKLVLEYIPYYCQAYLEDLRNDLSFIPLEELILVRAEFGKGDELVELIKARREDPKLTTIQRLYLVACSTLEPEHHAWLSKNVEDFQQVGRSILSGDKKSDPNQPIHFYDKFKSILHRRNYIESPMIVPQT
ncbi:uncharacterized protein FA14DRAFT_180649 [Meira miltonrushii]|uniref:F-box domain-containing protein n=1 Tax=Meira miltonrushii TaxID=1280837 RepID=A0A316VEV4_9BASI|nr:uncharacterized protein FA14DRAFT_180649 [Meira miltonrushii]PWN34015.1 hypothetical protein FA14DRAFT_180649 [Meira miltonrushii]